MFKELVCSAAGGAAAALLLTAALPRQSAGETAVDPFLVGSYGGNVAVFVGGERSLPRQVTGVRIDTLPRADAEQLREGIGLDGEEALARLLEDLTL